MSQQPQVSAHDLIELVADAGSWRSWDMPPTARPADPAYATELDKATANSGVDESVISGEATIRGRRVAVILGEFAFLAGSVGQAAADRLVAAFERATSEGLPVLAAPISGGTRMQEGTPAFVQMVRITAAVAAHKQARLPYIVYLRHPTTGGVMASWGSLGHVTAAAPGALVGFLGPRVFEALYGEEFPEGVQTAENLHRHGIIDAVIPPEELPTVIDHVLHTFDPNGAVPEDPSLEDVPDVDAWDAIIKTRDPARPGVREVINAAASHIVPLSGTGQGERDRGVVLALVRIGTTSCVVVGQDRRTQTLENPLGPEGLRVARRGIRLAADLGVPLLTVIDTPGAALSADAENGALAGEIARCLEDLVTVQAPSVCLMLGEGNGGGALALLPADRILAAQHAWLSPLPPEGASAIVHRDTEHAPAMARAQQVRALDLAELGIVGRMIPESPDAATEPETFCARVADVLRYELACVARAGAGSPAERAAVYARC